MTMENMFRPHGVGIPGRARGATLILLFFMFPIVGILMMSFQVTSRSCA